MEIILLEKIDNVGGIGDKVRNIREHGSFRGPLQDDVSRILLLVAKEELK